MEVLAVFFRLEVKVVEQLDKSLVELSDFDVGGALFDLTLDDIYLPVLVGE